MKPANRISCVIVLLIVNAALILAQEKKLREPDVIYVPTPQVVVEGMLDLAGVSAKDVVYDLGCGDGRLVVTAAKKYGARAIGIDINPERIQESNDNVREAGVQDKVTIRNEDLFEAKIDDATVVTLYLLESLNTKLRPKLWADLKPGSGDLASCHPSPRIVEHTDDARRMLVQMREEAEAEYGKAEGKQDAVGTTVWGRVSEQVRKLALLYAISENHESPAIDADAVQWEMRSMPDILSLVRNGDIDVDVYPLSIRLVKHFRMSQAFETLVADKMSLGAELMKDIGNVYCAALPGWIAAGLEEALERGVELGGRSVLAVGYGSGDAAEAMPMTVAPGWHQATAKIGFRAALEPHQTLTRGQYESLHDSGQAAGLVAPTTGFVVDSVGSSATPGINDEGIEYYRFLR